ncbi:MAG TPA: TRAP transporter small permease subunit [Thauera sp.]|nr:TRAP transporter small permease subunit [Thauera sp.]HRA81509.1 TRAP transporter small permease subunit [Thauera sp.]
MDTLLRLSGVIDAVSRFFGKFIIWLVLAATVISAANAIARKAFNLGSNAFLEIQWYLFGAVFLLGAGYTFLQNAHVRIDVVASKLSMRTRMFIDIFGILVFLLPLCWFMIEFAWPIVKGAYDSGEMSSNAGGLIRWPVYALVPAGFVLLGLQALSELIKRVAFLRGKGPNPLLLGAHDDHAEQPAPHKGSAGKEEQK